MSLVTPPFATAWAASQRIYSPADSAEQTLQRVAKVIGGQIDASIHDKKHPWKNTCAVRMSYILNECGLVIPAISKKNPKRRGQSKLFLQGG